jgi:hypothetical protein
MAISADEVIASLLQVDHKRNVDVFKERLLRKEVVRTELLAALKAYLSALLILCGPFKGELLAKTEMSEQIFMESWRWVFDYLPPDVERFDQELVPSFRSRGMDGLAEAIGNQFITTLFQQKHPLNDSEAAAMQDMMIDDMAAMKRGIQK